MFREFWHFFSVMALISFGAGGDGFDARNKYMHESKLIMKSLEDALNYLKNRPETVTCDVILGLFTAKANLQWIYKRFKHHFGYSTRLDGHLERILNLCQDLVDGSKFKNYCLLKDDLWNDAAENLKNGRLSRQEGDFLLQDFDSCESIDAYLMRGTPEDSDFCINELLTSNCEVSEHCWLSEVNGDSHSGYKTSHRLLYFQVATKMNCEEVNPSKFVSAKAIKNKLCQQMLLEAAALYKKPTFALTRDIFMEQIALCGLEGFEEFAPETWRAQVRNWQSYNGCFAWDVRYENCSERAELKRTDNCHSHVTAVAISALAFFLRVTLNLAFNFPSML